MVTGVFPNPDVSGDFAPEGWYSIFDPVAKASLTPPNASSSVDSLIFPLGGFEVPTPTQFGTQYAGGTGLVAQPTTSAPTPTLQIPAPVTCAVAAVQL